MLEEILALLHNYFVVQNGVHRGEFAISSGAIVATFLTPGQKFRVVGSVMNDGVYTYPTNNLIDEVFVGEVWALAVPPAVNALVGEIEAWCKANPASSFASESFGGYSYTRATKTTNSGSATPIGWPDVFRSRLNQWRKI